MSKANVATVEASTNGTPATKAERRAARKVARQGKPGKAATSAKAKASKAPKAPPTPTRAAPTNTVAKGFAATRKGVPVTVEPVQGRGGNRVTLFGHNVSAVLRWWGSQGYKAATAAAMLKALGLGDVVGTVTIGCQVYGWEARAGKGEEPAKLLTKAEGATLRKLGGA